MLSQPGGDASMNTGLLHATNSEGAHSPNFPSCDQQQTSHSPHTPSDLSYIVRMSGGMSVVN